MTLEDLNVFVAACQAENLSAVARALGCTQPAVSQHITRLEKEMGVPLLERRAKGVSMTQAGKVLYQGALEGLDTINMAVRSLEQLRDGESGSLGIATGGTTIKHFMKEVIVNFHTQYPKVSLHFHSANSQRRCLEALRNEQADLAFITMGQPIKGIEQQPVVEMPWVLVIPEDAPLASRKNVDIQELAGVDYITLKGSSTSRLQLESTLQNAGVTLTSITTVDDWDTAILFVEMGLGYAITPKLHASQLSSSHGVRGVLINSLPPVTFGWAVRRWNSLSQVAREYVRIFNEEMLSHHDCTADDAGLKVLENSIVN